MEININGEPLVVMMATPDDLEELAIGFAHTEGILHTLAPVPAVTITETLEGTIADIRAAHSDVDHNAIRARRLEGRSGCGLCGVESLTAAVRRPRMTELPDRPTISDAAIARAFSELSQHQPLNDLTHTTHAAAWCQADGALLVAREDVGRHNALDKVVGAMLTSKHPFSPGFVILSSRISFEMVAKAVAIGATLVAGMSAPTSLALQLAEQSELEVACRDNAAIVRLTEPTA